MYLLPRDVTPQSRRALRRYLDSRGGEELREAVAFLLDTIESGAAVKLQALPIRPTS